MTETPQTPESPRHYVREVKRGGRRHGLLFLVLGLMMGLLTFALYSLGESRQDVNHARQEAVAAKTELANALDQQRQQFDFCTRPDNVDKPQCAKPVTPPSSQIDPPPASGPGRAPSDAQVARAVAAYCAGGRCTGPKGLDATQTQVAAAVATYCDRRGQCAGPSGTDGSDGATGEQGLPGEQGPPPTSEQIAEAVAIYCGDADRCRGPQGTPGEPGQPGQSAFPFSFTFTVQSNPIQSTTYTVTCTAPGACDVTTTDAP